MDRTGSPPVIVHLTGLTVGALLVRRYRTVPMLLRGAVFAQIADLVTFAIVWNGFQEERNPLANLILQTVIGLTGDLGDLSSWLAAVVLVGLKCALIAYLAWAAPILGRYRKPVLLLATAAGAIGALSNARLFGIFIGPENIPLFVIFIAPYA
jgi:hypothetical protein